MARSLSLKTLFVIIGLASTGVLSSSVEDSYEVLPDLTEPVCITHEDCGQYQACVDQQCVEPCKDMCGNNTVCAVNLHVPSCTCVPGATGNPLIGCILEDNSTCADHDDCATHLSCVDHHCEDPCEGRCGVNTVCNVIQHIPTCACMTGATGNALGGCELKDISKEQFFSSTKKKIYQLVTSFQYDWKSSYVHCRRNDGYLAMIENEEENNRILELINATGLRNESFWVGGSDLTSEGDWIWATTGRPIEGYTNWKDNNPDNGGTWENAGNEHCLSYWEKFTEGKGYRWNDDRCSTEYQFICEYFKGNYDV